MAHRTLANRDPPAELRPGPAVAGSQQHASSWCWRRSPHDQQARSTGLDRSGRGEFFSDLAQPDVVLLRGARAGSRSPPIPRRTPTAWPSRDRAAPGRSFCTDRCSASMLRRPSVASRAFATVAGAGSSSPRRWLAACRTSELGPSPRSQAGRRGTHRARTLIRARLRTRHIRPCRRSQRVIRNTS
jgi:hypothetical protein